MRGFLVFLLTVACFAEGHRPLVMGHRGCRALRSENTIAAFRHAVKLGVDVVELDMVVTADDRIVVNHDLPVNLDHCFVRDEPEQEGPVFIRLLSFAETQEFDCGSRKNRDYPKQKTAPGSRMPALEEVFELLRGEDVDMMIETKMARDDAPYFVSAKRFARLVYKAVSRYGLQKRVILQSFDHRTLREMYKLDPAIRLCMLNPRKHLNDYVGPARELGATHQFINWRVIRPEDVSKLHAAGVQVFSGTTDDPGVWKRLVELKVDGILTDDPAGLLAHMK